MIYKSSSQFQDSIQADPSICNSLVLYSDASDEKTSPMVSKICFPQNCRGLKLFYFLFDF